jgi:hypothetical protein
VNARRKDTKYCIARSYGGQFSYAGWPEQVQALRHRVVLARRELGEVPWRNHHGAAGRRGKIGSKATDSEDPVCIDDTASNHNLFIRLLIHGEMPDIPVATNLWSCLCERRQTAIKFLLPLRTTVRTSHLCSFLASTP